MVKVANIMQRWVEIVKILLSLYISVNVFDLDKIPLTLLTVFYYL